MKLRLWLARARYAARVLDPWLVLAGGLAGFVAWLLIQGVKAAG